MQEDINHMKGDIAEIKETLKGFIECADKKYAPIMAWDLWKWVGGIVGGSLLIAAVGIIFFNKIP